jgi:olfactory receptor
MADFLSEQKKILYNLCAIQMYAFAAFADVECLILAVISYDCYVAICNPLLYTPTMSPRICTQLVAAAYAVGLVDSAIYTSCTFQLSFCKLNVINHFFCDIPPLLALSCSATSINVMLLFTVGGCVLGFSIFTVLFLYSYSLATIFRMNSNEGQLKASSTCVSRLTPMAKFHGTLLFMYICPSSSFSMDTDKVSSVSWNPYVKPSDLQLKK